MTKIIEQLSVILKTLILSYDCYVIERSYQQAVLLGNPAVLYDLLEIDSKTNLFSPNLKTGIYTFPARKPLMMILA